VTRGLRPEHQLLVVDIGGGSTEIVLAGAGGPPIVGELDSGSARLTRAWVRHDPPTGAELAAMRAEAVRLVAGLPDASPAEGVMVGGTASNLVRLLPAADSRAILTGPALATILSVLATAPAAALVDRFRINMKRARQLPAGAAFVEAFAQHYRLDEIRVSDASLRDGAILADMMAGDEWPARLPELAGGAPTGR